jgi:uncharacterized protein with GYD domain
LLFVTHLSALPGRYTEAIRTLKNPKIPQGIRIREYLGVFSVHDAIMIFEAPDEASAVEFVGQFGETFKTETAVGFPVEEFKWTM